MSLYELTYVLRSDLEEDALSAIQELIGARLADLDGEIVKTEGWGRRRLAFPIERLREAFYFTSILNLPGPRVVEFENQLKLIPEILRFLLIRQEERNINLTGSLLPAVAVRPSATPSPAATVSQEDKAGAAVQEPEATEQTAPEGARAADAGEEGEAGGAVQEPQAADQTASGEARAADVQQESAEAPTQEEVEEQEPAATGEPEGADGRRQSSTAVEEASPTAADTPANDEAEAVGTMVEE